MPGIKTRLPIAAIVTTVLWGCAPLPAKDDPWLSRDKFKHAAASAVVGAVGVKIADDRGLDRCEAFRAGAAFSITFGAAKELADQEIRNKGWSWRDLAWDAAGGILGSLLASRCR